MTDLPGKAESEQTARLLREQNGKDAEDDARVTTDGNSPRWPHGPRAAHRRRRVMSRASVLVPMAIIAVLIGGAVIYKWRAATPIEIP